MLGLHFLYEAKTKACKLNEVLHFGLRLKSQENLASASPKFSKKYGKYTWVNTLFAAGLESQIWFIFFIEVVQSGKET